MISKSQMANQVPRPGGRAVFHQISKDKFSKKVDEQAPLSAANANMILTHLQDLQYADVIALECVENYYRNSGKFIWDGKTFCPLSYKIDDAQARHHNMFAREHIVMNMDICLKPFRSCSTGSL
ncbi:Hypothetical protein POVR1_LOCUS85 [uncultured virus]|nr:Hypothetical protein POVR1_LOCUS85 [uncultured virus]